MDKKELVRLALEAQEHSYVPYSHFRVGAALLTESGKVYQGCNIENASYGATNCAERTAAFRAVFDGETHFAALAVAGFPKDCPVEDRGYAYPCGICRQVLREFALPGMKIYIARTEDDFIETTLEELLPLSFGPEDLSMHDKG